MNLLHTSISKLMPATSESDTSIIHCAILQQIVEQTPLDANTDTPIILHLTEAVKRVLWHQHTCHPSDRRLHDLHKITNGIPKISMPLDIDNFATCLQNKMRKAA